MIPRCLIVAAAFYPLVSSAAVPFRFEELTKVRRVGDFSLSPDGRRIAYALAEADLGANRMRCDLWTISAEGGQPQALVAGEGSSPRYSPDGKLVALLSSREEGGSQI